MARHVSSASKMPVSHSRSLPVTSLPVKSLPGKPYPVTSLPVSSVIGSTNIHQQNKPLGMVTPQMPNKMGHPKQAAVSPQIAFSRSKVQSQSAIVTPTKMSQNDVPKLEAHPLQIGSMSQTAKVEPQKQVYRPFANCTNDQLKRMHGHVEAFCRTPNCQGCKEVRKLKDDPTKKAQLIRQVEDEILLRSRELDSCWQEDELDCVRVSYPLRDSIAVSILFGKCSFNGG